MNYVLNKKAGVYAKIAEAESERTGIVMEVYTDLPAVQLYTGNGLSQRGKTAFYNRNYGFCLETQYIPNGVNVPLMRRSATACSSATRSTCTTTAYKFGVRK